jgi:N-formylglutamate amidohydrolase
VAVEGADSGSRGSPFFLRDVPPGSVPPLLLASPHSGYELPDSFLCQSQLSAAQLRRLGDAYVDELLAGTGEIGIPLIAARYSRTFLDLNRDPAELDPSIFAQAPPFEKNQTTARVSAGLGVIPRLVAQGQEIYSRKLDLTEAARRIAEVHTPYHKKLAELLARARCEHGFAVLVDCHSMPTPHSGRMPPPQFVLGDLFGRSAAGQLVKWLELELSRRGFRVARNAPYAGGYTTEWHANPAEGIHVVQLEIDRALYMDQRTLVRSRGFGPIAQLLSELMGGLLDFLPSAGLQGTVRLAAE